MEDRRYITDLEAAEYLNISIDEFNRILEKEKREKKGLTGYSTYRFIPYLEINGLWYLALPTTSLVFITIST